MSSTTRYINPDYWVEIERGRVFEAAMYYLPSSTSRPLRIVRRVGKSNVSITLEKMRDFSPSYANGRPVAKVHKVAVDIKPRKVIVLSNNEVNQSKEWEYIMVAPIFTIKLDDERKPHYPLIIKDEHPFFAYLPKQTSRGILKRYVDISQVVSIHKSMLLQKTSEIISADRMELIEDLLIEFLNLGYDLSGKNEPIEDEGVEPTGS